MFFLLDNCGNDPAHDLGITEYLPVFNFALGVGEFDQCYISVTMYFSAYPTKYFGKRSNFLLYSVVGGMGNRRLYMASGEIPRSFFYGNKINLTPAGTATLVCNSDSKCRILRKHDNNQTYLQAASKIDLAIKNQK